MSRPACAPARPAPDREPARTVHRLLAAFSAAALAIAAVPAAAQSSDGSTGAAVLALPAGSRAAGFGGAYSAGSGADALFYNPAGGAWLNGAASLAVQRHIEGMAFMTAAAGLRTSGLGVGVTVSWFDFGAIRELVPDPAFGGQRGLETGETVDAGEGVAKVVVSLPVLGGRGAIGGSFGALYATLAESARTTAVFDAGAQFRVRPDLLAGLALRNAGGDLAGSRLAAAPLPTELRLGAAWSIPRDRLPSRVALDAHLDLIAGLGDDRKTAAAGLELSRDVSGNAAAALRAGYTGAGGRDGVGRLHVGAGVAIDRISIDYTFQHMDVLGVVHRIGLRWSGARTR